MNLLPRDTEALCGGDNRDFQLIERVADQLAGGGVDFSSPYFLSLSVIANRADLHGGLIKIERSHRRSRRSTRRRRLQARL